MDLKMILDMWSSDCAIAQTSLDESSRQTPDATRKIFRASFYNEIEAKES